MKAVKCLVYIRVECMDFVPQADLLASDVHDWPARAWCWRGWLSVSPWSHSSQNISFFFFFASFYPSSAYRSHVNIMLRAHSKKETGRGEEVGGWVGVRVFVWHTERERKREKQTESKREWGACVFVSPPNQFSWGIYHRLQQRRQTESGKRR